MTHHVIVGGGPAAMNAVETIRQFDDGSSQITLICDEPAHSRMALPYWLAGKISRGHTFTGDDAYFQRLKTDTRIGSRVTSVNVAGKQVALDDGATLDFDTLLLATGSSPLALPIPGADLPGVHPLWCLTDTDNVLNVAEGIDRPRAVLIGAGFVGFIVLNALSKRGWQLSVVERQSQVLPRMLDEGAARMLQRWLAAREVDVHLGTSAAAIRQADDGSKIVDLESGESLSADVVIVSTGVRPNTELAQQAGLDVDQGILVDDRMQTSIASIYAAGDVAQGPVLHSAEKRIHAIQPTAVDHGRVAGANMAGQQVRYPGSLSMNVVDVCGLQCASYGQWDSAEAEAMTIDNVQDFVYRKLLLTGDRVTGAIFVGRANDLGMLTDIGMVKGMLQTHTSLGAWKDYLGENPFDIRRAYVAAGVADKLLGATLLGRPTRGRQYQAGSAKAVVPENAAHSVYVKSRERGAGSGELSSA